VTNQMNAQSGSAPSQKQQAGQASTQADNRPETNLSYRYGSIGIDAVAAAMRYAGTGKNPAYAPAVVRTETRQHENAI
jgi:hypothetical protein